MIARLLLPLLVGITALTACRAGSSPNAGATGEPDEPTPGTRADGRADVAVRTEPGTYPAMKREVELVDPVGGARHHVLDGVELRGRKTATLAMKLSTVMSHSFIPERVARALAAEDLGAVDLSPAAARKEGEVDEPAHLGAIYGVNRTGQTSYRKVRIERVNLGVGPAFGPVEAFVTDDANTSIGIVGRDWLAVRDGEKGFILAATGEVYFAPLRVSGE